MGIDLSYPRTQKEISKRSSTGLHLLTCYNCELTILMAEMICWYLDQKF